MRKVLVFKETLLPLSETFIQNQVATLREYRALLAGLERCRPSLALPVDAILLSEAAPILSDVWAKLYRRTRFAPAFHREALEFGPELIHAHFASGGRTALALQRVLKVPLIVTMHGNDITTEQRRGRYRELGKRAALFICVSEFIRQRAIDAGVPAAKLRVHYIGVDRAVFRPVAGIERGRHVLFVGRLVEKKGCEYAIRAMKQVQVTYPDRELRIVGDGPLRQKLELLAAKLKVNCRFLGYQPAEAVRAEMQLAKIFCVPSVVAANGDSEGLAMVFLEAQAMGLPVVTSDHGGTAEAVIDGVTGLLSRERDVEGLARSIVGLLGDEELWESFHRCAIELVAERFDLERQTEKLEQLYSEVAGRQET